MAYIPTQDFQRRENPETFHLLPHTEESVSESASGTCWRMLAWEQISCSCVYLVLTVHTGLFSTAAGCINTHSFPSQRALSHSHRAKNVKVFICGTTCLEKGQFMSSIAKCVAWGQKPYHRHYMIPLQHL